MQRSRRGNRSPASYGSSATGEAGAPAGGGRTWTAAGTSNRAGRRLAERAGFGARGASRVPPGDDDAGDGDGDGDGDLGILEGFLGALEDLLGPSWTTTCAWGNLGRPLAPRRQAGSAGTPAVLVKYQCEVVAGRPRMLRMWRRSVFYIVF